MNGWVFVNNREGMASHSHKELRQIVGILAAGFLVDESRWKVGFSVVDGREGGFRSSCWARVVTGNQAGLLTSSKVPHPQQARRFIRHGRPSPGSLALLLPVVKTAILEAVDDHKSSSSSSVQAPTTNTLPDWNSIGSTPPKKTTTSTCFLYPIDLYQAVFRNSASFGFHLGIRYSLSICCYLMANDITRRCILISWCIVGRV